MVYRILNNTLTFSSIVLMFCAMQILVSCSSTKDAQKYSKDKQSNKSDKNEFLPLFDGVSTKGWHTYGKSTVGKAWRVSDGALHLSVEGQPKSERGDLVTNKEYENFHLKLKWKISKKGNSGIIFNIKEDTTLYPATYNSGMEMQVLDNDLHGDGKIKKHRTGDLYDLISSSSEPVKPVGMWNQVEIISNRGQLDFYLNDVHILSTTLFDDSWKELISKSKFRKMPGFGTYKKGRIGLQDHDDEVWYKDILIKEL